jgi:hypothetical protein
MSEPFAPLAPTSFTHTNSKRIVLTIHSFARTNSERVPHVRTSVRGLRKLGRSPNKGLSFRFPARTNVRVPHPSRSLRRVGISKSHPSTYRDSRHYGKQVP